MKIEIEFKTGSSNASELPQKISPILNVVKQQGLDTFVLAVPALFHKRPAVCALFCTHPNLYTYQALMRVFLKHERTYIAY